MKSSKEKLEWQAKFDLMEAILFENKWLVCRQETASQQKTKGALRIEEQVQNPVYGCGNVFFYFSRSVYIGNTKYEVNEIWK